MSQSNLFLLKCAGTLGSPCLLLHLTGNWLRLFMGRELEEVAVKHCIFFLELLERDEGTDHTYLSTHPSKSCGGIGTGSAPHASTRVKVNPSTSPHMSSCAGT